MVYLVDWEKIDNCRREIFRRHWRNGAKNFAALRSDRLLFCRLGVKRTTIDRFILRCERAQGAVIRDRNPRTDRQRSDQHTRRGFHADSIADVAQILKWFL
jgi:hypothetical protein